MNHEHYQEKYNLSCTEPEQFWGNAAQAMDKGERHILHERRGAYSLV